MAEVNVYNLEGTETGKVTLDDAVFNVTAKPELIHHAVRVAQLRKAQPWAHTKDRGDVRGGGKKPWRQKGTGRARHGSIRSPLWRGGGITFGPRTESLSKPTIPRKMARKALWAVLADRVRHNGFIVVDSAGLEKPSTKKVVLFLKAIKQNAKKALLLSTAKESPLALSVRNLRDVSSVRLENINILDALAAEVVIIERDSVETLAKQLTQS